MPARREAFLSGLFGALGVAATALVLYLAFRFLQAAANVSTPFVAALVIALLCDPVVRKFQAHIRIFKGQRAPAVVLVFVLFLLGFVALLVLVIPSLISQLQTLVDWLTGSGLVELQKSVDTWLKGHPRIGPITLPHSINGLTDQYSKQLNDAAKQFGPKLLTAVIGSFAELINVILIPLLTFFILMDLGRLRKRLIFLLPTPLRRHFVGAASDVGEVFSNYLRGMMQVSLAYMVVSSLLFAILSLILAPKMVGSALLIGIVSGALYIVPYIGFLGAAVTAVTVALVNGAGIPMLIGGVVLLAVLNGTFDNVVTPRIVGQGVGIHPIVAIFALLIGASLFQLWGMLLAYPMAGSIQVVLFRLFPKLAQPTPERAPLPEEDEPLSEPVEAAAEPSETSEGE